MPTSSATGFIPARHTSYVEWMVARYVRGIMTADFAAGYCLNLPPRPVADAAMIVTPNHVSWWDGFWALEINRRFWKRKFYIMMLEEQLRRYPLFSRAGAFSINPASPKHVYLSLHYLAKVSAAPDSLAVFFPQGKIEPDLGPVKLKTGLTKLQPLKSTFLYPYYACVHGFNRRKPTVFFYFGRPISFEKRYLSRPEVLEREMNILRIRAAEKLKMGDFGTLIFGKELEP
ncbi:MAG: lysophospholipid acyltransferase family protein [Bacteroidia bacterium]|nr:lysophospholipid acyltransferase family protein [Bacteroidia bacterium]MDW8333537.1 lysophospholipid acyltransferase family protein [Bacteroidia bacterium]